MIVMESKQPSISHYLSQFEETKSRRQREPAWLADVRQSAIERAATIGFPTIRDEDWRYTPVGPTLETPFQLDGSRSPLSAEELRPLTFAGTTLFVFVNGHYLPELSDEKEATPGVTIQSVKKILSENPSLLEPFFSSKPVAETDPFLLLNTAFSEDGIVIRVAKGKTIAKPIHLLYLSASSEAPVVCHPRNLIIAEENASVIVIESYDGFTFQPHFRNTRTEIHIGENAQVTHYKIQDEALKTFHVGTIDVFQAAEAARLVSNSISLGGAIARTNIRVNQEALACESTLNGLYLAAGTQHMDAHILIDHTRPRGTSSQLYKGILDGKSRGVFNGKVIVRKEAEKTVARQTNKNLLLSEEAEADPLPQLEILNNDVMVSHGATVGQLDREQLHYLRSRGIEEAAARSLLTFAFASDLIEKMAFEPIRRRLRDAVISHLPEAKIVKEAEGS